jgi:formate/nitrite transporter FocA (FNT family)
MQGLAGNLVSVTTGNIFGGGFMVAVVYWFIYRRPLEGRGQTAARRVIDLFLPPR